jgi:hypothetical protein
MVIRPIQENLDSPIAPPVCSLAAAIQPQLALLPLVGLTKPTSEVKTTISKHFGELYDPRKEGMVEHKLLDMVTIAVCGDLRGAKLG